MNDLFQLLMRSVANWYSINVPNTGIAGIVQALPRKNNRIAWILFPSGRSNYFYSSDKSTNTDFMCLMNQTDSPHVCDWLRFGTLPQHEVWLASTAGINPQPIQIAEVLLP